MPRLMCSAVDMNGLDGERVRYHTWGNSYSKSIVISSENFTRLYLMMIELERSKHIVVLRIKNPDKFDSI
jgi:hypothetical protein